MPKRHDEILRRLPPDRPVRVAEVGVWDGRTSRRLLKRRDLTLYMVDRWTPPEPGSRYAESASQLAQKSADEYLAAHESALRKTAFAGDRAIILRGDSVAMAEHVDDHSLDLAFIDADHTHDGVLEDVAAWLFKVNPGGFVGGHDYGHPRHPGVQNAVDAWVEAFKWPHLELGGNHTWFVRLPKCADVGTPNPSS